MARDLIVLPRFKRDYRNALKHPEFDSETLEHVFDLLIAGGELPRTFNEHRLDKHGINWAGYAECHLGTDLLLIYRVLPNRIVMHRIGTHMELFGADR